MPCASALLGITNGLFAGDFSVCLSSKTISYLLGSVAETVTETSLKNLGRNFFCGASAAV